MSGRGVPFPNTASDWLSRVFDREDLTGDLACADPVGPLLWPLANGEAAALLSPPPPLLEAGGGLDFRVEDFLLCLSAVILSPVSEYLSKIVVLRSCCDCKNRKVM